MFSVDGVSKHLYLTHKTHRFCVHFIRIKITSNAASHPDVNNPQFVRDMWKNTGVVKKKILNERFISFI